VKIFLDKGIWGAMHKKIWFVLLIVTIPFLVALYLAEFSLKKLEKHNKQKFLDYKDVMRPDGLGNGGYLREKVVLDVTDGLGGSVRWQTNAEGFRSDRDFSQQPAPGVLRILALGDSFNAGYRVGQEDTLGFLLEQWINQHWGQSEVLIAETEEPTTAVYYLQKFGLAFHPHIVLLGITIGNDIAQAYVRLDPRGGYELKIDHKKVILKKTAATIGVGSLEDYEIPETYFRAPGRFEIKIKAVKKWFHKFHLVRRLFQDSEGMLSGYSKQRRPKLIDMVNGLAMFLNPTPPMIEEAYQRLFTIISAMQIICEQHHLIFAVELFPQRYQVQPPDWDSTVERYNLKKSGFDLMQPNHKIRDFCRKQGINLIDPTGDMAKRYAATGKRMYLPRGDMHWNKEGHRAFFECAQASYMPLIDEGFKLVPANNREVFSMRKTAR
jgi:hypothetical protein